MDWTNEKSLSQFLNIVRAHKAHKAEDGIAQAEKWANVRQQLMQTMPSFGRQPLATNTLSRKYAELHKAVSNKHLQKQKMRSWEHGI